MNIYSYNERKQQQKFQQTMSLLPNSPLLCISSTYFFFLFYMNLFLYRVRKSLHRLHYSINYECVDSAFPSHILKTLCILLCCCCGRKEKCSQHFQFIIIYQCSDKSSNQFATIFNGKRLSFFIRFFFLLLLLL